MSNSSNNTALSAHAQSDTSSSTLWEYKIKSYEAINSFEMKRKKQIDELQDKDRQYWQVFEQEIYRGKDENTRLLKYINMRLQADLIYAESMKKMKEIIESKTISNQSSSSTSTISEFVSNKNSATQKAFRSLGDFQTGMGDKFIQFVDIMKKDVLAKLDDMCTKYNEQTVSILRDGRELDTKLINAQRCTVESFGKYAAVFHDSGSAGSNGHNNIGDEKSGSSNIDLWLAEISYSIAVSKLQQTRVEYVKGMSTIFQQYKALELDRTAVLQTVMDIFIRKQRITLNEIVGLASEPIASIHQIEPERELLVSIRRIPKNNTAAALSSDKSDIQLFESLQSPFSSPLVLKWGFLKYQAQVSIFKTWKNALVVITRDTWMHIIDIKDQQTDLSSSSILQNILLNEQVTTGTTIPLMLESIVCQSMELKYCKVTMLGKTQVPSFEVLENTAATSLLGSILKLENTKKIVFQSTSQTDLLEWVIAARGF